MNYLKHVRKQSGGGAPGTGKTLVWAIAVTATLALGGGFWGKSEGAMLHYMSDLIASSRPATSTNHVITFRPYTDIPAGGKIVIVPHAGAFDVPITLDHTDIDLATSSAPAGPYVNRTLATTSSAVADGVSVTAGTSSAITITLNSSQGISASSYVRVTVGTQASFGASGDAEIVNPSATGTYRIYVETQNSSNAFIEAGTAMIAIVAPVTGYGDTFDFDPPVRSNGLPSGTVPADITQVEVSLNTDEIATCKYATSSGVSYGSMANVISATLSTFHMFLITGLQNSTTYSFYVRCADRVPNVNPDDFVISFTIGSPLPPPGTGTGPPGTGGSGGGSGGGAPGGGGGIFPPPVGNADIILSGFAYPGAALTVLRDNAIYAKPNADGDGTFGVTVGNIPQGTHTFSIFANDSVGRKSSPYSATLTIVAGTHNSISGIVIPPTIAFAEDTLEPGETAQMDGESAPESNVEVEVRPQKRTVLESEIVRRAVAVGANGKWSLALETRALARGTYEVRARTKIAGEETSGPSQIAYLGIGESPTPDFCGRSDLNTDTKVNLVDFSILLFHWGSTNALADINIDGKVTLVDFSVMLFCWTG